MQTRDGLIPAPSWVQALYRMSVPRGRAHPSGRCFAFLLSLAVAGGPGPASAQPPEKFVFLPRATEQDGPGYVVSRLVVWQFGSPFLAPEQDVQAAFEQLQVSLARVEDGFIAPRRGVYSEQITIADITRAGPTRLYGRALDAIARKLKAWYAEKVDPRIVFVAPSPVDIDPVTGQDLRRPPRDELAMHVVYDGPSFNVRAFELSYYLADQERVPDQPGLPALGDVLANTVAMLTPSPEGYVTWRPGIEPIPVPLSGRQQTERFTAAAIQGVLEEIYQYYAARQIMAVRVTLAVEFDSAGNEKKQLDTGTGKDLRDSPDLRIDVIIGLVRQVRTLARGERIPPEDRLDNEAHRRILERSPFQPWPGLDVLNRGDLDDYLYHLSRHPGRRVDASIASSEIPGGVSLDYHVTENKPLLLYGQLSNTGTEQTNELRTRLGLYDSQLTGNDDILAMEYMGDFFTNNSGFASYDAPFAQNDRLRWRVMGNVSEYTASEVGFASEQFIGHSWGAGGEIAWNFFQYKQLFLDFTAGARYEDVRVENELVNITGHQGFFLPSVGLDLTRFTEEAASDVRLRLEWQTGTVTNIDPIEINELGRLFPSEDWAVLRWDASQTFYLEPLINRAAWEDVTAAETPTLAHEIALRFRGQYAFDYRLIPQEEQVAGGLYTVRGYPEAVAVGDTVLIGNVEYRFHVPRALPVREQPGRLFGGQFRWAPQRYYGRPDWDLVLRAFLDVGHTINSQPFSFEQNQTLIGTGVGVELSLLRNLNARVDWGVALKDIPGQVTAGSNRFYFVVSVLY